MHYSYDISWGAVICIHYITLTSLRIWKGDCELHSNMLNQNKKKISEVNCEVKSHLDHHLGSTR